MKKEKEILCEKIADFIFESNEEVTFPILLAYINKLGITVDGEEDFVSDTLKNCIYWRGISKEAYELLKMANKLYNITLQPYGFDNRGVVFYKEKYPDMPIFNHFLMDKMSPKTQKQFMKKPYMMPVFWVPLSKAKMINRPL